MKKKICLLTIVAALAMISGCATNNNQQGYEESNISSENGSSSSSSSSTGGSSSSSSQDISGGDINKPDPSINDITIKAMLNENGKNSNTTKLYRITGIAQWPKNTNYGNFDLVDDTGYIYVYGCSKNKSTIKQSGSTYSYSNDKTYSSMNIKAGDEVTMEGLFVWYKVSNSYGYGEFQGYVTTIKRNNASNIQGKNYTNDEPTNTDGSTSYYSSIESTDSGSSLLTKLHNLMDTTHQTYTSYSSLDNYFKTSDKHSSGNVKCFYSGENTTKFNKEHVWPQSLSNDLFGEDYAGADLHHIRPTISTYNSIRSNAMFAPVYGTKSVMKYVNYQGGGASYCTGNVFEPADSIKGDVARIIMYVFMHYANSIGGNQKNYYGDLRINWVMGTSPTDSWKLLRKWNAEDPVSQDEITRNNYAYSVQKNRNPFIDHPTYADRIWG